MALDTVASSLVGIGADRRARTPCFTYADSRCAAQVGELRRELNERVIQQRTGCRLHASYLTARLRWLRDTMPDTFRSVRHWMSLGEYIQLQILEQMAAGAMEVVAISYARIAEQLQSVAGQPQRILASGRVTQDLPAWLQMLADVLDAPVIPVTIKRSTVRGTALIALDVLAPDVVRTPSSTGEIRQPVADRAASYRARKQDYQTLYEAAIAPARAEPQPGIASRPSSPRRTATSGK